MVQLLKGKRKAQGIILPLSAVMVLVAMMATAAYADGEGTGGGATLGFYVANVGPQEGTPPPCLQDAGGQFILQAVGDYTVGVGSVSPGPRTYAGVSEIRVDTDDFWFGPQGTYGPGTGDECDVSKLGPLSPVSITNATVSQVLGTGTVSCSDTTGPNEFWRVNTHVHMQFNASCVVSTTGVAATNSSDVTIVVEGEQIPVSLLESCADGVLGSEGCELPVGFPPGETTFIPGQDIATPCANTLDPLPVVECPADVFVGTYAVTPQVL